MTLGVNVPSLGHLLGWGEARRAVRKWPTSFRCTCGLSGPSALGLWRGICFGRGKVHFSIAWCPLPVGRTLLFDSVSKIPEKTAHLEMSSGSSSIEAEEKREPAVINKQKKIISFHPDPTYTWLFQPSPFQKGREIVFYLISLYIWPNMSFGNLCL